ncbi:MAG: CapA family protein [Holophagales bacterium]|nr:CapA family protein [Holophagales bacterium]
MVTCAPISPGPALQRSTRRGSRRRRRGKVEPSRGRRRRREDDGGRRLSREAAARHRDGLHHVHDVSHSRAYGIQDTTPPNDQISFRKAIDAGADAVLGSGPHVLRGIELRNGKPIFYSLSNFIYQYRTPKVIPTDLPHQRDSEVARPPNVSVWDRRDPREVMESVVARMTYRDGKLRKLELIPVTIDDEGLSTASATRDDAARQEIVELLQRLSTPYGTSIA